MILFERQRHTAAPASAPVAPAGWQTLIHAFPGGTDTLHYTTDACSRLIHGPDWWLYAATPTGLDVFSALRETLAQAREHGLDWLLDRLETLRPVAFVGACERRGTLYFGRSFDGFAALYFGTDSERLVVSNDLREVGRRLGGLRFSDADAELWSQRLMLEPESSFYEGVRRCYAGVRYTANPGHTAPGPRQFMAPAAALPPQPDPARQLTDGLRTLYTDYGNRKVALRLSGGVDSRVLLVGLMDAVRQGILRKDQILCTSVAFPGFDCDESPVIRQLIEVADFEWARIEATPDAVRHAYAACLQLPAPPFPTSFIGALCAAESRARNASLILTGHGGDELFDFDQLDILGYPFWQRLRRLGQLRALRQSNGWLDEIKTARRILLGRRNMPHVERDFQQHHLSSNATAMHRLGRRLVLARGVSYATAAAGVAAHGLRLDLPYFRGPFLDCMDPLHRRYDNKPPFKPVAQRYIGTHVPEFTCIPCRKVPFGPAVLALLPKNDPKRDEVDSQRTLTYSSTKGLIDWRTAREATDGSTHEQH